MGGFNLIFEATGIFNNEYTSGIISWLLGCIFLWSGIVKLRKPMLATLSMMDFGIIKRPSIVLGYVLSIGECCLGIVLILRLFPRISAGLASLLLLSFVIAIARSLLQEQSFACYCFGGEENISQLTLARACSLLFLAVLIMYLPNHSILSDIAISSLELITAVALLMSVVLVFQVQKIITLTPATGGTIK